MNLIAVVDDNWGVGYAGELLFNLPPDMQRFKTLTTGNVVVMGRTTFDSIKNPLPNRLNIVLSSKLKNISGAIVCKNIQELANEISNHKDKKVFVIGGETVYKQMLDYCEIAYITKVKKEVLADTYLTNLDSIQSWKLVEEGEIQNYNNLEFTFCKYEKIKY